MSNTHKKGIELPMNAVVITAILLVVMIVLIVIFSGRMKSGVKDIDGVQDGVECPENYVGCAPGTISKKVSCASGEMELIGNFAALREGKVCCCDKK